MKKSIWILLIILFPLFSAAQVKIIFDTDFGGDADDLGALAMLHHLQDNNEIELLAVMSWSTEKNVVAAIDGVNRFYGNPDVPIGVRKDEPTVTEWNYTGPLAEALPHKKTNETAPDATILYREILAQAEDQSIVVVTVGPLANIQYLLKSEADDISGLSGKELVHQKVKEFVIMGGHFPEGEGEWNFDGGMKGVTKYVLENLEVPVTFSGFEIGVKIKTAASFESLPKTHPLYIGFAHFSENAPWMKQYYDGKILNNSSYDQTAVLYAARGGVGKYWDRVEGGYCVADEKGNNYWKEGPAGNQSYLVLTAPAEKMEALITKMMLGKE